MSLLKMVCKHCGQSAGRLALFAMMQDAGAITSVNTDECWAREEGGEHEFVEPSELGVLA